MAIGSGAVDKSHVQDALRVVLLEISHEVTHEDVAVKLAGDLEDQDAQVLLQVGRAHLLKWVRDSAAERYRHLLSLLRTRLGDAGVAITTPSHPPGEALPREERPEHLDPPAARPNMGHKSATTPAEPPPKEPQGQAGLRQEISPAQHPTPVSQRPKSPSTPVRQTELQHDFSPVRDQAKPAVSLTETPPQTPERAVQPPSATTGAEPSLTNTAAPEKNKTPITSVAPVTKPPPIARDNTEANHPTDLNHVPKTKEDYVAFAQTFVKKDLERFFGPNDPFMQRVAAKAATLVDEIAYEFDVDRKLVPGLVKLALYDFVMLCDNSGSMDTDDRFSALCDALQRIAKIANKLEPAGMSVRFLNHRSDHRGSFDRLKSGEDVEKMMALVPVRGPTRLGQTLRDKIVEPMIMKKAREGTLTRPVIVALITDGKPDKEPMTALRDTIRQCKRSPDLRPYGDASVVFIVSRIGSDPQAEEFIRRLGADPQAGSMVFCCKDRLDERRDVFQRVNDRRYTGWLMRLFLEALDGQTTTTTTIT